MGASYTAENKSFINNSNTVAVNGAGTYNVITDDTDFIIFRILVLWETLPPATATVNFRLGTNIITTNLLGSSLLSTAYGALPINNNLIPAKTLDMVVTGLGNLSTNVRIISVGTKV